ncbi:Uncharacterized protein OS=Blastopirellula marina DSM 3645 GN=DSM3645_29326 PE=4 SV=1 [Gemmata massiliana]|uniref:Carboxypeptidase regulatory-like domain-containing protein n=1 Tax=Gemmata massiliana TaxID=1210884 RepID=A0A6P2CVS2_9BACT|nr:hypothetical protein [Gemmata massiliana]VTR93238.1 Uncharacterized protein OS=Blastopirellula marina DSM 3645 GN=DSM3645_29326 PE=4 SV=1 [Gemmata massiliana]
MNRIRITVAGCAALVGLALCGCGGAQTGDVTGRVTYQGKRLAFGSVVFMARGEKSEPVVCAIGPDGTYTAKGVPVGEVQVGVASPDPRTPLELRGDQKPLPLAADPKLWFPIPTQYSYPLTSGLSRTVTAGPNTHDIELK